MDATIFDALREETAERAAAENVGGERPEETRVDLTMRAWSLKVPEPKFGVLNWDDFPFQLEWYSDEIANAREVVWQKSTQVGMSAYAWRWGARRSDQFGDTTIYVFPTDVHVRDFAVERVDPAIDESPYLQDRIPAEYVRQQKLKRLGKGWLHFRGSTSRAGAQSVAGDALVFDEYDELDPANLAQMERRLSGARAAGRYPRIRRFGVPTVDAYGINARYQRSDRRVWMVECAACNEVQEIRWEENLRWRTSATEDVCTPGHDVFDDLDDVVEAWRACRACEERLDVRRGNWVPQNPGAPVIGFYVCRLIVPNTDLEEIVKNSRKTAPHDLEAFWNNDLGLPYSPAEASLTEEDVRRAASYGMEPRTSYAGPFTCTMGVDVASARNLHYRISIRAEGNVRKAVAIGEAEDFDEIADLIERFDPRWVVIDHMPERREARDIQAKFPGRVMLCRYDETNPDADAVRIDEVKGIISVHRTEAIDGMMDGIRHLRNVPLKPEFLPRNYVAQMVAMKRRTVEDARGRPRRVYVTTGTRGDDFAHAEVYDLVANEWARLVEVAYAEEANRNQPAGPDELGYEETQLVLGDDREDDDPYSYDPGLREY